MEEETRKPNFPLNKTETNKKAKPKEKVGGEENTKFTSLPILPKGTKNIKQIPSQINKPPREMEKREELEENEAKPYQIHFDKMY